MEQHNRDIFPSEATQTLYKLVSPLVANKIIQEAFSIREGDANRFKKRYHRFGRLAMACVVGGALYTVAQALVLPAAPTGIGVAVAAIAGLGLVIEIVIIVSGQKQKWLNNRFAAERIRSINFQAYGLACVCGTAAELQRQVDDFYREELILLDNEMNASRTVLKSFSPLAAVARVPKAAPLDTVTAFKLINTAFAEKAGEAYAELRTRYQVSFAADEVEKLEANLRIDYTVADILYLFGAGFTVAALTAKLIPQVDDWVKWIDFAAVSAFILGLAKTLMDNASLGEESRTRYRDYHHTLGAIQRQHLDLPATILSVEQAALDELRRFCQAANRISYRL